MDENDAENKKVVFVQMSFFSTFNNKNIFFIISNLLNKNRVNTNLTTPKNKYRYINVFILA